MGQSPVLVRMQEADPNLRICEPEKTNGFNLMLRQFKSFTQFRPCQDMHWKLAAIPLMALLIGACALSSSPSSPMDTPSPVATSLPAATMANTPTRTPAPSLTLTRVASPTATLIPTHRIGVRRVDGAGEFYDRQTGEKFIPRGFNYVRLAPMSATNPNLWHSTLNPGFYDPERAELALQTMRAAGYNVVRIFIDCCREGNNVGDPAGGLSDAYLENVIDFLKRAEANKIYVLLISDLTPAQGGYDDLWQQCCTTFDGENLRYLTSGGHRAERRFNQDFIRALIERQAPMKAIFAYDLTNEVHFSVDKPPFNLFSGKVTTANHQTYEMASPEEKRRMMDENLVYWIDQQRAAILEVDPTALVTVSFPAINSGQTTVHTGPAIRESTADFIDLHAYLGWGLSLEDYVDRFEIQGYTEKPIILGEFGAAKRAYPSAAVAAQALQEMQVGTCGYGFDGWLLWTWDGDEQKELWNGLSENGEISAALAPKERPDPCLQ